ncbi:MAG: N-acetylmuramoyl-L-alanine amidase [Gammaproteobacteria bacterium]|nr:N-acetylmuramoyl-L-alanine amidase [Gammaproteobacteria bacterium]
MKIINHRLYHDDDTPYPFRESPNHSGVLQAKYLVMHYTASPGAEHAINWLSNPAAKASAHVVIGRDGSITQLVPFNVVAWHAGKSVWNGLRNLNRYSLGIELDNAGSLMHSGKRWVAWFGAEYKNTEVIEARHKNQNVTKGWHLYTPDQLYAALEMSSVLAAHYHLKDVLGHEDIAPRRKTDPGPAFPMEAFRARVFGRPDAPESGPEVEYVTIANLNIRKGPGASYDLLEGGPLPKGTWLEVEEEEGNWRQVTVPGEVNGLLDLEGWVHVRYIKPAA